MYNSLRQKILVSMVMLVLLSGLITVLVTRTILLGLLKTEFKHKGLSYARGLSANSVVDILTQNTSRLKQLIENEKSLDRDIAYAFIIDPSGRILAHTFNKGFPIDLARVNNLTGGKDFNIQALDTQWGLIYDIATPVFLEKSVLAEVRLGLTQNSIRKTIATINLIFILTTLLIVFIGIFLAQKISVLITKPVSKLVEATQSIKKGDFSALIDVKTKDEIGLLASAFNDMSAYLNQMVKEIERLTRYKEREKIALDIHDGCAQDIANIIKRVELCERLLEIDPPRISAELEILKGSARDALDKTRQVISDLKLPHETDFNLLGHLSSYIKNYQKQNDISVKLDISGAIDNIPPDKTKPIFYIIREALNNIRKHAQANNVELLLECSRNNELTVNIKDDGQGFDIDQAELSDSGFEKLGLASMRQRASSLGGTLAINSVSRQGTEVSLNIPFDKKES